MLNLLSPLFTCIACKSRLLLDSNLNSFPLCPTCREDLVDSPSLCSNCGSPCCIQVEFDGPGFPQLNEIPTIQCQRPWISRPEIHSYSARYLLLSSGYKVLRKWKIHRGKLFDQQILRMNSTLPILWKNFEAQAIVPIPQRFNRAWKMGGSRSEILAKWISNETQLPILKILKPGTPTLKRQAELGHLERLQSTLFFVPDHTSLQRSNRLPERVILVDDFMTTGHTFRKAAQTLLGIGLSQIHVFCLGVRLSRFHLDNPSNLIQS